MASLRARLARRARGARGASQGCVRRPLRWRPWLAPGGAEGHGKRAAVHGWTTARGLRVHQRKTPRHRHAGHTEAVRGWS